MKRFLVVVAALILGIGGVLLTRAWAQGQATAMLDGENPVSVLTVARAIPAGSPAGEALRLGYLRLTRFPAASVPPGALSSLAGSGGLVTDAAEEPGQILTRTDLVPRTQQAGALAVPPGMVAVTLQFCLDEAVAGYVEAGSQVAVFGTTAPKGTGGSCGSPQQAPGATTRLIAARVLVLAAGPAPAPGSTAPPPSQAPAAGSSVLLTVAVTQAQAAALIALTQDGQPYLALLTPSSRVTADPVTRR